MQKQTNVAIGLQLWLTIGAGEGILRAIFRFRTFSGIMGKTMGFKTVLADGKFHRQRPNAHSLVLF
jgi:hypothetical protein